MRPSHALFTAAAALLGHALIGCGSATPGAQTAAEVAVVNVGGGSTTNAKTKGAEVKVDPKAAPAPVGEAVARAAQKAEILKALEEAAEFGAIGVLSSGGVPGGVVGGVIGTGSGSAFGAGGLGLSGVGLGGGGTGIGLGSIGTIGHGGFGYGSSHSSNPVPGQSIHVSGNLRVELGDSVTLGVSLEASTRMLRDRAVEVRGCYSQGLQRNGKLAGTVALRLVVGSDGHVKLARELGSDIGDREVVECILKVMDNVYVTYIGGTSLGVIETTVRLWQK